MKPPGPEGPNGFNQDRKSTRLNSSHSQISYAVFCLKKKKTYNAYLKLWFAYLDRDFNVNLSAQEARFAPPSYVMIMLQLDTTSLSSCNVHAKLRIS